MNYDGVPLGTIMVAGRWRAERSCLNYVQTGKALQVLNGIAPDIISAGEQIAADLYQSYLATARARVRLG